MCRSTAKGPIYSTIMDALSCSYNLGIQPISRVISIFIVLLLHNIYFIILLLNILTTQIPLVTFALYRSAVA